MKEIPKIIHITCKSKDDTSNYSRYLEKIKHFNPYWEIRVYDDSDARQLIENSFPFLLAAYDAYQIAVQRTDMFRIAVVYKFGGFYMDMDMSCIKSLDSLLGFNIVIAEEKTLSTRDMERLQLKHPLRIANYMFGSVPGHPFWIDALKEMVVNSNRIVSDENDVLETTGPGLVTNVYHEKKEVYKDIALLQNIDRMCTKRCSATPSCHFGDYAVHHHLGSWRWQNGVEYLPVADSENNTDLIDQVSANHLFETLESGRTSFKDDLVIIETYPSKESSYDGLTGIFSEVKGLGKVLDDTRQLVGAKILVCGIPTLYEPKLSPNNTNIVFTTFESDRLPLGWAQSINRFNYCIVPHEEVKKVFERSGIKIPIAIIQNGFRRYKRNWSKRSATQQFTVGFIGVPVSRKNLHKLYDACKQLQQTDIPNIKLAVHVATFYDWQDEREFDKIKADNMVVWTTGKYNIDQVSQWYSQLSCYAFPSGGEGWSCTPRESLYLGIPTLLSDIPVHKELAQSGFCKVIKTTGVERANFNGTYHGNWAKIETAEIKNAILDVYRNYGDYKELAKKGAAWIEDKWLNQEIRKKLLDFIATI